MSAITVLIVEKLGNVKEQTIKNFDENELYKKAGYKTAEGFKCYAQWNIEELNGKPYSISVYGKTTGRANQENKYEFPPPIDNTLFFGNCIIVNKTDNSATSISADEWENVYEHLFGGFEDLGDEDDDEEDEDEDDDVPRTKNGYVKDGFVIDDDEVEEEEEDEEEEEEEDEDEDDDDEPRSKKSKVKAKKHIKKPVKKAVKAPAEPKVKAPKASKKNKVPDTVFNNLTAEDANYLDCTSELVEEEYV
jgi:hypothetical protein